MTGLVCLKILIGWEIYMFRMFVILGLVLGFALVVYV